MRRQLSYLPGWHVLIKLFKYGSTGRILVWSVLCRSGLVQGVCRSISVLTLTWHMSINIWLRGKVSEEKTRRPGLSRADTRSKGKISECEEELPVMESRAFPGCLQSPSCLITWESLCPRSLLCPRRPDTLSGMRTHDRTSVVYASETFTRHFWA